MPFCDLNDDAILACLKLLCNDVMSLLALSSVSRRLYDLSLSRPVWGRAYDANSLGTAFGPKSRHSVHLLKEYVLRYSKASANFRNPSPKVVSWNFFPMHRNINPPLLFGRFLFRVTESNEGTYTPVVSCFDMDDSLRLLWENKGDWPGWGRIRIRSAAIDHREDDNGEWSEVSVLLKAIDKNLLDLRRFRIEQTGHSIKLYEAESQVFEMTGPGSTPFIYQGKWLLRSTPPPYLANIDKPKHNLGLPLEGAFDQCSFAGKGHIIVRTNRTSTTNFDLFRLSELEQNINPKLIADERNANLKHPTQVIHLEHLPQSQSHFDPPTNTPDMSFLCRSAAGPGPFRISIMNILASPPALSQPIHITEIDERMWTSAHPSLYCGWLFGFEKVEPTSTSQVMSVFFSKLLQRLGGGLEYGTVKEVVLPDGVGRNWGVSARDYVFDEFAGRLYFQTKMGVYVINFA